MSMLSVNEDRCLQALKNVTLVDRVLNRARSSVSMLSVSEDRCLQALKNVTLVDTVLN